MADAFALASEVPSLLAEVAVADRPDLAEVVPCYRPTAARLSRRPSDYVSTPRGVLPMRWERVDALAEPPTHALRWLLHVLALLRDRIDGARRRIEKQVAEASASRLGFSVHARRDALALGAVVAEIRAALVVLGRAERQIFECARRELLPSERVPNPFPRGSTWRGLRLRMPSLLDATGSIAALLRAIDRRPKNVADVQYLYQRWCCLRVVRALEGLGWKVAGDVVGPLYLGGRVTLRKEATEITAWIEPRLSHGRLHPSGFSCTLGGEAMPDLLLVTPGPFGVDGWVLDPTLTSDEARHRDKAHYRDVIAAPGSASFAGVRARRQVVRAWAAAPIRATKCKLLPPFDGTCGVVPMHALEGSEVPLRAWLDDVCSHAELWASRRPIAPASA